MTTAGREEGAPLVVHWGSHRDWSMTTAGREEGSVPTGGGCGASGGGCWVSSERHVEVFDLDVYCFLLMVDGYCLLIDSKMNRAWTVGESQAVFMLHENPQRHLVTSRSPMPSLLRSTSTAKNSTATSNLFQACGTKKTLGPWIEKRWVKHVSGVETKLGRPTHRAESEGVPPINIENHCLSPTLIGYDVIRVFSRSQGNYTVRSLRPLSQWVS